MAVSRHAGIVGASTLLSRCPRRIAGPNIIEQTIRQKLPRGFQHSEFLLSMLSMDVHRLEMRDTIELLANMTGQSEPEPDLGTGFTPEIANLDEEVTDSGDQEATPSDSFSPEANDDAACPMSESALTEWLRRLERLHPSEIDLGLERVRGRRSIVAAAPTSKTVVIAERMERAALRPSCRRHCSTGVPRMLYRPLRFYNEEYPSWLSCDDADIVLAFEAIDGVRGDISLTYLSSAH